MATDTETGEITGTKNKQYNLIWFTAQSLDNALRMESHAKDAERETTKSSRVLPQGSGRESRGWRAGQAAVRPAPDALSPGKRMDGPRAAAECTATRSTARSTTPRERSPARTPGRASLNRGASPERPTRRHGQDAGPVSGCRFSVACGGLRGARRSRGTGR